MKCLRIRSKFGADYHSAYQGDSTDRLIFYKDSHIADILFLLFVLLAIFVLFGYFVSFLRNFVGTISANFLPAMPSMTYFPPFVVQGGNSNIAIVDNTAAIAKLLAPKKSYWEYLS